MHGLAYTLIILRGSPNRDYPSLQFISLALKYFVHQNIWILYPIKLALVTYFAYQRNVIVQEFTVLSCFLAHAPIAEKPHFEKVLKNQFVPAFWRMRLYSNRGAGAPINAHMS